MHILVIGGTRFMGPYTVRNLREMGHEVTIFHRGEHKAELPTGTQEIQGDFNQLTTLTDALQRLEPEVVLHMMAVTERQAQDLLTVFTSVARRIVVPSSQDVYQAFGRVNKRESGPADPSPITEDSPLRKNLYPHRNSSPRAVDDPERWMDDYDKILVERTLMGQTQLPATILRLPAVYGPLDYQHRMFLYLKHMLDKRPVILLEEKEAAWRWTHGYVENVADAIALTITDERASGRVYNVGEPFTFSLRERIEQIALPANWHGKIVELPANRVPEGLRWNIDAAQDIVVDSSRLRQELNYTERVELTEAFRRTIAWEGSNPPSQIDPQMFDYQAEDQALAEL